MWVQEGMKGQEAEKELENLNLLQSMGLEVAPLHSACLCRCRMQQFPMEDESTVMRRR